MASIGHVAVGMAAARLRTGGPARVRSLAASMLLWSGLSMLPDADVLGFAFGVRYGDAWGHRGATHSFAFAIALGVSIGLVAGWRAPSAPNTANALNSARSEVGATPPPARNSGARAIAVRTALLASLVLASHGLLDTLTDGGRGCALLWPFSDERHFAPLRPIPVAPIGLGFISERGLGVALAELVMFAPLFAYALWPRRCGVRELGGRS